VRYRWLTNVGFVSRADGNRFDAVRKFALYVMPVCFRAIPQPAIPAQKPRF
jgi:hypothetical protein